VQRRDLFVCGAADSGLEVFEPLDDVRPGDGCGNSSGRRCRAAHDNPRRAFTVDCSCGVIQIAKPLELRRHYPRGPLNTGRGPARSIRSVGVRKMGVVHGRRLSAQKSCSEIWNWLTGDMGPLPWAVLLILKKSVVLKPLRGSALI